MRFLYRIYSLISSTFFTWNMACILPAAYTRNIPKTAWNSLEDCMIQKSFKNCSISNSLDGTEDDILWTDVRDDTHDTDEEHEDDTYERRSTVLIDELPSSDEEDFLGFEQ